MVPARHDDFGRRVSLGGGLGTWSAAVFRREIQGGRVSLRLAVGVFLLVATTSSLLGEIAVPPPRASTIDGRAAIKSGELRLPWQCVLGSSRSWGRLAGMSFRFSPSTWPRWPWVERVLRHSQGSGQDVRAGGKSLN